MISECLSRADAWKVGEIDFMFAFCRNLNKFEKCSKVSCNLAGLLAKAWHYLVIRTVLDITTYI